jgi:hypothetical protein
MWWVGGSREGVSHLGAGAPFSDDIEITNGGLGVGILRDMPTIHIRLLPEFAFAGKYPYLTFTDEEERALVKAVGRVRKVQDDWGGANWISIKFVPRRVPKAVEQGVRLRG